MRRTASDFRCHQRSSRGLHAEVAERFPERVPALGSEPEVQAAIPAFREGEPSRSPARFAPKIMHRLQVGIHALAGIEPIALARVGRERGTLLVTESQVRAGESIVLASRP